MTDDDIIPAATDAIRLNWANRHDLIARAVVAAVRPLIEAQIADDMDAFRVEVYGTDLFRRPTKDDYAEVNALLQRERGHQLDGIAADAMDRAIRVQAERLRESAGVGGIGDVSNTGDTERAGQHTDTPPACPHCGHELRESSHVGVGWEHADSGTIKCGPDIPAVGAGTPEASE